MPRSSRRQFKSLAENLKQEQIKEIDPAVISMMLSGLTEDQVKALGTESLTVFFAGLTEEQTKELDPESLRHFFGMLSEEQLKVLLGEREEEIRALLEKADAAGGERGRDQSPFGKG